MHRTMLRTPLLLALALLVSAFAYSEPLKVAFFYPEDASTPQLNTYTYALAGQAGKQGATLAAEEFGWAAQQEGLDFQVLFSSAPTGESAVRAAQRLMARENVFALIGGFETSQAQALSQLAEDNDLLFLDLSGTAAAEAAPKNTFHLMPTETTWLQELRNASASGPGGEWLVVYSTGPGGERRLEQARSVFFAGPDAPVEKAHAAVEASAPTFRDALGILQDDPGLNVLLLLDWQPQLDFLGHVESSGLDIPQILALPDTVTTTREFYGLVRAAAPAYSDRETLLTPWEATLESPEASALNSRYLAHFGEPMDPAAWAAYEAVRLAYESARLVGTSAEDLRDHLAGSDQSFNVDKDSPVMFDAATHELRQPLYTVQILPYTKEGTLLERKLGRARLETKIFP